MLFSACFIKGHKSSIHTVEYNHHLPSFAVNKDCLQTFSALMADQCSSFAMSLYMLGQATPTEICR